MLLFMFIPNLAQAKIVLCKKTCSELRMEHINTIKGLIYELAQSQDPAVKKIFLPHAAKTIVWMNKLYKDKKVYNLESFKENDKAKLIITCVEYIVKVVNGEENLPIKRTLNRWGAIGKKVIAEYEEKKVNVKNSKPKTIIKWKLELSKR